MYTLLTLILIGYAFLAIRAYKRFKKYDDISRECSVLENICFNLMSDILLLSIILGTIPLLLTFCP